MDSAIQRYTPSDSMTLIQYVDDLYEKFCKVADINDEATLTDIFVEGLDSSICHSLRQYWATHLLADGTDIGFKTKLLFAIQKSFVKTASFGNHPAQPKTFARHN